MSTIIVIDLGTPNDDNGDPLRTGGTSINTNFANLNTDKLERGGYAGTAQDLSDAINGISTVDFVTRADNQTITGQKIFSGDISINNTTLNGVLTIAAGSINVAPATPAITTNVAVGLSTLKFINGLLYEVQN